jgi:hypothetical protein
VVFSAGINQRLYSYAAQFDDFFPDEKAEPKKRIVLKVSDYRSALVQGKFLAKRGLWVSEFRIESGLNCGGHAFATEGHLLGPVLEEFKQKRQQLVQMLQEIYVKALRKMGRAAHDVPLEMRITVQGGIGTVFENDFLLNYYHVDGTGWGTPFLLVPEVTNVDRAHLQKLLAARPDDVTLSDCSPLGVPFWNLRTSASEEARRRRIHEEKPGSTCPKGFTALSTEFTQIPICIASRAYVKRKLKRLPHEGLSDKQLFTVQQKVLEKSCICHDLAGSATLSYNIDPVATPAICCGPNIVNFSRLASLEEMVGHIYGRLSLLANAERPHMFVQELKLYVEQLRREIKSFSLELSRRPTSYFSTFKENLLAGIDYYHDLARRFFEEHRERFLSDLKVLQEEIESVILPSDAPANHAREGSLLTG